MYGPGSNSQILGSGNTELIPNTGTHQALINQRLVDSILSDGQLSAEEIHDYPELAIFITETLGYPSVESFVGVYSGAEPDDGDTGLIATLNQGLKDAIRASLAGFVNPGSTVVVEADSFGAFPTDLNDDETHVVLRLADGTEFTFDGPKAGRMANEFAEIYKNSLTFYQNMNYLADQHGGKYSFHSAPLNNGDAGYNWGDFGNDVVVNSNNIDYGSFFTLILIHEVSHDLHDGTLPDDAPQEVCRCGAVHSREQTLFVSNVINELEHAGIDTGVNTDTDDYSNNSLVFDSSISQEQSIKSIPESGLTTCSDIYSQIKQAIADGDFATAMSLLSSIGPATIMTVIYTNPQTKVKRTETLNVLDVMLQDLMLISDSGDRFNQNTDNQTDKAQLSLFFISLVKSNPDFSSIVQDAADEIGFQFKLDLPIYSAFLEFQSASAPNNKLELYSVARSMLTGGVSAADAFVAMSGLDTVNNIAAMMVFAGYNPKEVMTLTGASYADIATAFEMAGISLSDIANTGARSADETLALLLNLSDDALAIFNAVSQSFFTQSETDQADIETMVAVKQVFGLSGEAAVDAVRSNGLTAINSALVLYTTHPELSFEQAIEAVSQTDYSPETIADFMVLDFTAEEAVLALNNGWSIEDVTNLVSGSAEVGLSKQEIINFVAQVKYSEGVTPELVKRTYMILEITPNLTLQEAFTLAKRELQVMPNVDIIDDIINDSSEY